MKKAIFILFLLIFASSASATVYKWMDERGVVGFTDDLDNVPSAYRDNIDVIDIPRRQLQTSFQKTALNTRSGEAQTKNSLPIAQILVREGDFAVKLAEALHVGRPQNEAEAESLLASAGIAPGNGWIADYPMTPDIIGELQDSIGAAVDSGKLLMNMDKAMKAFQDVTAQQGLSVGTDEESQEAEEEPVQSYEGYSNPEVISDYYNDEGPPVVTYYLPPPDYGYLYSWVPYPFRCSGFRFRGFFVLKDFHRFVFADRRRAIITNHIVDPKTRRFSTVNPRTRGFGKLPSAQTNVPHEDRGTSSQAQRSASSILERSQNQVRLRNSGPTGPRSGPARQIPSSGNNNSSASTTRIAASRPPSNIQQTGTIHTGASPERSENPPRVTTAPRSHVSPGGSSSGDFHGSGSLGGGGVSGGSSGGRR